MRIWIGLLAFGLLGCGGKSALEHRVDQLEKQDAAIIQKVDLHDQGLVTFSRIIDRMQKAETDRVEAEIAEKKARIEAMNSEVKWPKGNPAPLPQ